MGHIIRYHDYNLRSFRLRYYSNYHLWILRLDQRPGVGFFEQFSSFLAKHKGLSNCKNRMIDLRDLKFINHDDVFCDVVNVSFMKLDANMKYVVLCNTPLESAFFYLIKQKALEHNIAFNMFSTVEAALAYLNIPADPFDIDTQLMAMKKNRQGYESSLEIGNVI